MLAPVFMYVHTFIDCIRKQVNWDLVGLFMFVIFMDMKKSERKEHVIYHFIPF